MPDATRDGSPVANASIDRLAEALAEPAAAIRSIRPDARIDLAANRIVAEWGDPSLAFFAELPASHDPPNSRYAAATLLAASRLDARVVVAAADTHELEPVAAGAVLTIRPADGFLPGFPSTLAGQTLSARFIGRASHAAAAPERGINALEAALAMIGLVNGLRQHLRPESRIDAVVVDGGAAPNVVPESAEVRLWLRTPGTLYLRQTMHKLVRSAEMAANANRAAVSTTTGGVLPNAIESATLSRLTRDIVAERRLPVAPRPPFFGTPPTVFAIFSHAAPALALGAPDDRLCDAIDVLVAVADRYRADPVLASTARGDLDTRLRRLKALADAAGDE